jgi:hypothetical protein
MSKLTRFDTQTGSARLVLSIMLQEQGASALDKGGDRNYGGLGYDGPSGFYEDADFMDVWKKVYKEAKGGLVSWPPASPQAAISNAFSESTSDLKAGLSVVKSAPDALEEKARALVRKRIYGEGPEPDEESEPIKFPFGPERVEARYVPDRDVYRFRFETGSVQLSAKNVEWIVSMYVRDGSGKSKDEVAKELMLDEGVEIDTGRLRDILRALGVKKRSPAVAPHRLALEDAETVSEDALRREAASMEAEKVEREADFWKDKYEEASDEASNVRGTLEGLIEEAEIASKERQIEENYASRAPDASAARTLCVLLSDFHVGKKVEGVCGNEFDVDVARERAHRFLQRLKTRFEYLSFPLKRVRVFGLGDMIDGPAADMYSEQSRGQDVQGLEQVSTASAILSEVVTGIDDFFGVPVAIDTVPGNHGRASSSHSEDPFRLPEMCMYRLAQEMTRDTVSWRLHETRRYARFGVEGTEIFIGHGDDGPRDPSDLQRVADSDDILVAHGHGHETEARGRLEDRTLVVQNGCLCGTTDLDEDGIARRVQPSQKTVFIHPEAGPVEGPTLRL